WHRRDLARQPRQPAVGVEPGDVLWTERDRVRRPERGIGRGRDRDDAAFALIVLPLVEGGLPRTESAEEERDEDRLVRVVGVPVARHRDGAGGGPVRAQVNGGDELR